MCMIFISNPYPSSCHHMHTSIHDFWKPIWLFLTHVLSPCAGREHMGGVQPHLRPPPPVSSHRPWDILHSRRYRNSCWFNLIYYNLIQSSSSENDICPPVSYLSLTHCRHFTRHSKASPRVWNGDQSHLVCPCCSCCHACVWSRDWMDQAGDVCACGHSYSSAVLSSIILSHSSFLIPSFLYSRWRVTAFGVIQRLRWWRGVWTRLVSETVQEEGVPCGKSFTVNMWHCHKCFPIQHITAQHWHSDVPDSI